MQPRGVASSTAATWAFISRQSPRYTYGGSTIRPSQPASVAARASATASAVVNAEMDATTGALPLTALTQLRRILAFSSKDKVAPSPRDPRQTTPVQPF